MLKLIWLVPLLPLAGFAFLGLFGRKLRLSERVVGLVACAVVGASFLLAAGAVVEFAKTRWAPDRYTAYLSSEEGGFPNSFVWIPGGAAVRSEGADAGKPVDGGLTVNWVYQVDALSSVMLLVVTGVGFLIHVFATGYMRGDTGYTRFFAYLNLFMFSMLVLVLGANFPMLFVGWEGVGLCSYLLIGFWFEKTEAANAAKKAFIANRVGDFGFLLGMFGVFALFGTMDFGALRAIFDSGAANAYHEHFGQFGLMSLIALGLFVGATGKSAQIPLFVWLPDAMAGPTPVSALIHAATMVTAGVYMVTRVNFIFQFSPTMMFVVAVIGALTAVFAATIAFTQNDIKKVLAYSTVSQLGYMFLACGVGAFSMGIFHVMTHAFFKALLFLGAGSVIVGMHHEQDMRHMGGLRKYMPTTFMTMVAAWLAICGIFPLAGFFSKDGILWSAWSVPNDVFPNAYGKALWVVGIFTAACTAFYMTRLMCMTFFGDGPRGGGRHGDQEGHGAHDHRIEPHESPAVMTVPLVVLAVLSVVGGWVGIGAVVPLVGSHEPPLVRWLAPIIYGPHATESASAEGAGHPPVEAAEYALAILSLAVAVSAIYLGYTFYVKNTSLPGKVAASIKGLYAASYNKYWVDEAYGVFPIGFTIWLAKASQKTDSAAVDGAVNGTGWLAREGSVGSGWVDRRIVDGFVNLVGNLLYGGSLLLRAVQTGLFQNYALAIVLGLFALFVVFEWHALAGFFGGGQ